MSIVTDVPREKAYHLKPRLLGKIAVLKCIYEVSVRPTYPSSKKVNDYDKLEAEVESIGIVLSIDWKDVGAKEIESTLHDDLALKT
ncbi:hypothetical protein HID58_057652 [Brassica napus]|uniref:Uncharacterized protein n=1 Tax=Brassica napus TaxID=3708 RepID=A0ABQ8ASJ8_BRANA|nr:hypothetical protein HID58_057652 [Brassica napus]